MKNKNHFKSAILFFTMVLFFTNVSYSQSLLDLKQKIAGKALIKKITAIDLTYNKAIYIPLSGTAFGLQIEATLKNGKKKQTGNGTKNTISWENYEIEVEGGNFYPSSGMLEITNEVEVNIKATLISSPTITSILTINPLKIKQLSLSQKKGVEVGEYILKAEAILSDNSTIHSYPGKLPWEKLELTVQGADFFSGKICIPNNDHRGIKDDKLSVNAKVKGQEDINFSLDIPLNYEGELTAYFNGTGGRSGRNGKNGKSGASGKPGSGERAGGDGGNGQRGTDGSTGGNGSDGEDLEIFVGLDKHSTGGNDILKIHIKSLSSGKESYLKLDPIKGSLNIYAEGGNGGSGGSGGSGGTGGSGGGGTVSGKTGNGGNGGNGGSGGDSGSGGNVDLYVHPAAKKYMDCIIIHNKRGRAGDGGSPGSGGQCPNNCTRGENGERGDYGRSGINGEINITERDVVLDL